MKKKSMVMMIISIIFIDILTGMEFSLFAPSFKQIQTHFHVSSFWIEALLSANFLGYCISLFFVGTLADFYGRKPIILYGIFLFIIGTILCLLGVNYELLLVGRFLQGVGIAAPAILSFLIIADRYPIEKQQFFMAMLNGSLNIAAGIAPVIGSYIALYFQWRGNFFALLILGIIAFMMTVMFISSHNSGHTSGHDSGPTSGHDSGPTSGHDSGTYNLDNKHLDNKHSDNKHSYNKPCATTKTGSKLTFGGYKKLFQSKTLLLLILNSIFMSIPYWVFVGISPLLYIKSLHVSLHYFGFYQGILAFSFAIGSIVLGLIINRLTRRTWLNIGLFLFILSFCMIVFVTLFKNHDPVLITLSMLVFVIAQIIPNAIIYPLFLNYIPEAKAKVAAVQQGGRLIFSAIALQITGYMYHGSFDDTGAIIAFFVFMIIVTQVLIMRNKNIEIV